MTTDERIAAVEHGLIPCVRIRGRPEGPYALADRMARYGVPGASIAVIHHGEVAWSRGYGWADAEAREATTAATLFQAASISKPVTAFLALRFVAEGRLDLDRDVNGYLRSWQLPENEHTRVRPVTLRHLLAHAAGTTVHGFPGYAMGTPLPSRAQILDGLPPANTAAVRVDIPVGSATRYSGGGTTIVEQVLEDMSGATFAALADELVLAPLGMSSSTFHQPLPATLSGHAASAHEDGRPIPGRWHVYPEHAAAGLWTIGRDLATFATGVQRALRSEPRALMPSAVAELMVTPHGPDGLGLGLMPEALGWRWCGHSGGNRGFGCRLVFDRHGEGAVVMTNTGRGGTALMTETIGAIAQVYGWEGYFAPEIEVISSERTALERFAGPWDIDGVGIATLAWSDSGLRGTLRGQGEDLLPVSERQLVGADSGWRWEFDADGETAVLTAGQSRYAVRRAVSS